MRAIGVVQTAAEDNVTAVLFRMIRIGRVTTIGGEGIQDDRRVD